ncbi:Nephrocystin-3 [Fusarium oxysporum f. sp. cubense race 1]|uniref:Nephrocystin-3 n=1 Tax=Fusarium oxysporum f. sp. cubense (strain race 1) TaxID=1229664 RepID=N4UMA7_FUSC1|nr:Nephrocystin-3 [Fusarium oxysporum f. sp. cubense race 1]
MAQAGLHVIYDSASSDSSHMAEIDIVAVHGLNFKNSDDHARKTWTMGDKLWLKDFLPSALSKPARVMLFEYNSSPAIGATAIKLAGHANNLLQWLKLRRKAFVAATLDVTYKSIVEATRLLVFFATPHQGGNYASLGDIVAKIVRTGMSKPRNDLLDALKENSDQAMQRFEQARHLPEKCLVVSFYEGDSYGKIGLIVDKKSATLNLPGTREKQIAMHADHSTICKFDSSDSPACELVLGTIADEVDRALTMGRSAPFPVSSYPLSLMTPVKTFVQRPSLRDNIRNQLMKPLEADRQGEVKKVGVWGMGGAGKSQLALSYLQRYRTEYDATFWIQADQAASVDRDFLAIYRLLAETTSSLSDPNPEDVKREVLSWFARASGKYLVIFDGADSLHQTDKDFVDLSQYCPGSPNTHIIITSRSSIAKSMSTFEGVSVEELEESQSVKLFLTCAEIQPARENVSTEAKAIVNELGHLPLAVSMAGKYVVMTVWETSYAAVSEHLPEAGRLLTLLCFIHYDDIFLELFGLDTDSGSTAVAPWMSVLEFQMGADLHQLERCFRVLENYSLCQRKTMQTSYSAHRLVHAWGYDRLQSDGDKAERFWYAASQLLDDYIKTIGDRQDGPGPKLRVAPHLTNNIHSFEKISRVNGWNKVDWLETVERFGIFFKDIGRWNDATVSQKGVLEKRRRILGDDHPDTITAMSYLANTLGDQGKLDEALSMGKEVLEKRQRILGDEHPDTITAINNLANTLGDQGKLDEALSMRKEVLEKRQRILSGEHPDTISAMNNLAITLSDQGKLDEAASMRKEVLEKMQQVLGDEHPDTLLAMHGVAITLGDQGKLDEAVSMRKEVLKKMQQVLGDEHPDTISAMNNLAITLSNQGKLDKAASMMREVLEKRKRILGDEHPDTITAINNLANTLGDQGKLDEALSMRKEVLEKRQRILSGEHPDTISAMNNLAITLSDQGKLDEAASMRKEVLEKMQQVLGDEHPDTLLAMHGVAITLGDQGKLDEAVSMRKEVLKKMQQVLGDEHPDTISAMNNLAITLSDQGKLDEAASMTKEVLEKSQRILGDEHPDTIAAMSNLALTLGRQGKLDEAASMTKEVLEKSQRILGDEHPDTLLAMHNLALTLGDQGKLDEAAWPPDTLTTKKQPFLKRVTGKLQQVRHSFRSRPD